MSQEVSVAVESNVEKTKPPRKVTNVKSHGSGVKNVSKCLPKCPPAFP